MSQYPGSTYDPLSSAGYENDFDIFIQNGTSVFSEEAFAEIMQQCLSGSHEDATTACDEQDPTAQWAEIYRLYHSQEYPLGGHGSQYGGVCEMVNPTDSVNYAPTQVTNEDQTITSASPKYQSKRAEKRAALEAQGINFGIDFRKKDEVKVIDGVLHVRYRDEWKPAVYHHELRAKIIAKAPPELYAHCPARGLGKTDVTSFWEPHRTWGFRSRADRPQVLFQWLPLADKRIDLPNLMKYNGRLVIDPENHPIRDWPIPFCLSSEVENGRLEAMSRENGNRISKRDFRARMPPTVLKRNGSVAPLTSENAIGMRRIRFRDQAGLLAWAPREGSSERKKALVQCIPSEIMAQIVVTNNTRYFRDLTKEETLFINRANRGLNPQKAGSNKLSANERQQREAAKDVKLEGFQPVNEPAWPYLDDPDNNEAAIARARMNLGLLPAGPSPSAASTHGVAVDNQESEEQQDNSVSMPTAQSCGSSNGGKKRFRVEELEPSGSDSTTRAKRRCDFAEFGVNASNQSPSLSRKPNSEDPRDLMALDYDHELRNNAQCLSYIPRPVRNVTPRHESLPGKPKFAHQILREESEVRWVNPLLEGPLRGSQTLPHTMRPFEGQFASATASNIDRGHHFERDVHTVLPLDYRLETPTNEVERGAQNPRQPLDYRLEVPANEAEKAVVRQYIGLAEADYTRYLGVEPPNLCSGDASYIDQ